MNDTECQRRSVSLADYEERVRIEEADLLITMAAEWTRLRVRDRAICRMQADALRLIEATRS